MSTGSLILIGVAWLLIGLSVAFVMRRRGHDLFVWVALGVPLGPLVIALAVERARYHGITETTMRESPTPDHQGFDLLAGLDGSAESLDAVDTALQLFGDKLSSVTIATVLDYDSESSISGRDSKQEAQLMLDGVADAMEFDPVETAILFGRPDLVLAETARATGIELIVVGARGHGAAEAMFGSTTGKLVGASEVPVFVGPVRKVGTGE